jgi:hypothetical protein
MKTTRKQSRGWTATKALLSLATVLTLTSFDEWDDPQDPDGGPGACPGCQLDLVNLWTISTSDDSSGNILIDCSSSSFMLFHGRCKIAVEQCTTDLRCRLTGAATLTYPNWPKAPSGDIGKFKYSRPVSSSGLPYSAYSRSKMTPNPTQGAGGVWTEAVVIEFIPPCSGSAEDYRQGFGSDPELDGEGPGLASVTIGPVRCTACQ